MKRMITFVVLVLLLVSFVPIGSVHAENEELKIQATDAKTKGLEEKARPSAAISSQSDATGFVEVSTFEELKSSLSNKESKIKVIGNITISEPLTITSNLTIVGDKDVILTSGLSEAQYMFNVESQISDFKVTNIILDGKQKSKGIEIKSSTGTFDFDNVTIRNFNINKGSALSFNVKDKAADDLVNININGSKLLDNHNDKGTAGNITGYALLLNVNANLKINESVFDNNGNNGHGIGQLIDYRKMGANNKNVITINNSVFKNFEVGDSGGALKLDYSGIDADVIIDGSTFQSNVTTSNNGQGSAINIIDNTKGLNSVNLMITQTKFAENTSQKSQGGAICASYLNEFTLKDVEFIDNYSKSTGGAISIVSQFASKPTSFKVDGSSNTFKNNVSDNRAGAIAIIGSVDVNINNAKFISNTASSDAGAISSNSTTSNEKSHSFVVSNTEFSNNESNGHRGVLNIQGKYDTKITDARFIENTGQFAGAIHIGKNQDAKEAKLLIENSTFESNKTSLPTGYGGAIVLQSSHDFDVEISNSIFDSNTSSRGGVIFSWLNPTKSLDSAILNISVMDTEITNNKSTIRGGVIETTVQRGSDEMPEGYRINLEFVGSTLTNNESEGVGGAIYLSKNASLKVDNSSISNNKAGVDGGAIHVISTPASKHEVDIVNAIIRNNEAIGNGGAISITLENELSEDSTDEEYHKFFSMIKVDNTNFTNNTAGNGGFILSSTMYPKLALLEKENIENIQGLSIPFYIENSSIFNNYDISFMSKDPIHSVKITYDSNGGTEVADEIIGYNEKFTKPTNPERDGYIFDGWYLEDNVTQYNFQLRAIDDVTVYAQWTKIPPNEYSVIYTDGVDGEEIFKDVIFNAIEGTPTPEFEGIPVRVGYKFIGWSPEVAEIVTGEVFYVAQWEKIPPNEYSVIYTDGVDGEEIFKDLIFIVIEGTPTPEFEGVPVREGYRFIGWSPKVTETVSGSVIYEAQWEKILPQIIEELPGTGFMNNNIGYYLVISGLIIVCIQLSARLREEKQ